MSFVKEKFVLTLILLSCIFSSCQISAEETTADRNTGANINVQIDTTNQTTMEQDDDESSHEEALMLYQVETSFPELSEASLMNLLISDYRPENVERTDSGENICTFKDGDIIHKWSINQGDLYQTFFYSNDREAEPVADKEKARKAADEFINQFKQLYPELEFNDAIMRDEENGEFTMEYTLSFHSSAILGNRNLEVQIGSSQQSMHGTWISITVGEQGISYVYISNMYVPGEILQEYGEADMISEDNLVERIGEYLNHLYSDNEKKTEGNFMLQEKTPLYLPFQEKNEIILKPVYVVTGTLTLNDSETTFSVYADVVTGYIYAHYEE